MIQPNLVDINLSHCALGFPDHQLSSSHSRSALEYCANQFTPKSHRNGYGNTANCDGDRGRGADRV